MRAQELDAAIADPATYADEAKCHAILAHLRSHSPVHWTEPIGYDPFWAITKYNDIQEIERQPEVFVNAPRTVLRTRVQEDGIRKMTGSRQMSHTILQMDGSEHRTHRLLTQSWFAPAKMRLYEERIGQLARMNVDEMIRKGGECDFVKDVSVWYPLQSVAIILGVPLEDTPFILRMTQQHFGSDDPTLKREGAVDSTAAVKELFDYFNKMTEERRKRPKEDIFTLLADATIDDKPISDYDRNSYYFILAVAGHDTTSSSISGTLLALLQHPGQLAKLRENMSLLPSAIDEGLRWVAPAKHMFRTATKDAVVRDRKIRKGDSLLLSYPSANRDEEIFAAPYEFLIDRKPNKHLTFGYGVHLCLGQYFAKLEMKMMFVELLSRLEEIHLAGQPEWIHANFVGGLKSLPLVYRANQTAA